MIKLLVKCLRQGDFEEAEFFCIYILCLIMYRSTECLGFIALY